MGTTTHRPGRSVARGGARALVTTGVALCAGLAGLAGGAGATTATSVRSALEKQLSDRQQALASLTASTTADALLSTPVRQTLLQQLMGETSGIDALLQSAPTLPVAQLKTSVQAMFRQYRVYLVMEPKVHFAERVAHQVAIEQKAIAKEPAVATRITQDKLAGATVQAAQAAYQSLVSDVRSASTDSAQVNVTTLLAQTPTGYPGNAGVFSADRTALADARGEVPHIRFDIRQLRAALRALRRDAVTGSAHRARRSGRSSSSSTSTNPSPTTSVTNPPPVTSTPATSTATGSTSAATTLTTTLATLGTFTGPKTATTAPPHGG